MSKLFIDCKYTDTYYRLCNTRKSRVLVEGEYYEKHHIIPRSLKGGNEEINIVALTAREHFVAHWLLTKMCIKPLHKRKMFFALSSMQRSKNDQRKLTSMEYEVVRKSYCQEKSEELKAKIAASCLKRVKAACYCCEREIGVNVIERHIEKCTGPKVRRTRSEAMTPERRAEVSKRFKGKKQSAEMIAKRTRNQKGTPKPKIKCDKCGKEGDRGNMRRWHLPNCNPDQL